MNITDEQIRAIVKDVVKNVSSGSAAKAGAAPYVSKSSALGKDGVFENMEDAIQAAHEAFETYRKYEPQQRKVLIDAVRQVGIQHKTELSRMVYDETKMGRIEHKLTKHVNASTYTPGVEALQSRSWSGGNGLCVEEYAPFGVIGSITPSTHPSATLISNAIMMLAVGNTVVFNAHPAAKNVSAYALQLCNRAIVNAGGPKNLLTCVAKPTIESANLMFNHELVKLLSITGGPGVVKAAMKASKKVLAAGPGNPPTVIDETADLANAAERITASAAFDNNILCTAEKQIFVVDKVFNAFMQEMTKIGNYKLNTAQMNTLAKKVFVNNNGHYAASRDFVGRNANVLAREIGIHLSDDVMLLFGETPKDHLFVEEEQLMPCIPIVRVKSFEEGVDLAVKTEHGYGHTASVHTKDLDRVTYFSKRINCSIFVANGATYQGDGGGEGEGTMSFTIATPTGESVVKPYDYARVRRVMVTGSMRLV